MPDSSGLTDGRRMKPRKHLRPEVIYRYYRSMYRTGSKATHRSSLEVFILALISQGHQTTYDLQTAAGLSLGATVPALARLSEEKLVNKKIDGRRHEFSLTKAGEKVMREWQLPSGRLGSDFDDLLRTAFLCALLQRDAVAAAESLAQAARARDRAAEDRRDEVGRTRLDPKHMDAEAYRWMRLISDQHRLAAESKAMELIATEIRSRKRQRK